MGSKLSNCVRKTSKKNGEELNGNETYEKIASIEEDVKENQESLNVDVEVDQELHKKHELYNNENYEGTELLAPDVLPLDPIELRRRDLENKELLGIVVEDGIAGPISAIIYCPQLGKINVPSRLWHEMIKLGSHVCFIVEEGFKARYGTKFEVKKILIVKELVTLMPLDDNIDNIRTISNKTWAVDVKAVVCSIIGEGTNKQGFLWNDLIGRIYLSSDWILKYEKDLKAFNVVRVKAKYDGYNSNCHWTLVNMLEIIGDNKEDRDNFAQLLMTDDHWRIKYISPYDNLRSENYGNVNGSNYILEHTKTYEIAYARWFDLNANSNEIHVGQICRATVFKHISKCYREQNCEYKWSAVLLTPQTFQKVNTGSFSLVLAAYHPSYKTSGEINRNILTNEYSMSALMNHGKPVNGVPMILENGRLIVHLDKKLGKGRYGEVCKGVFEEKHEVAVKRVPKELEKVIDREIKSLIGLKHDYIVKYYCRIYNWADCFLILELGDCNLETFIKDGLWRDKFPQTTNLDLLVMAAKGLTYIHEKGIVHRDIKPQNYLIKARSKDTANLLLTDFGLSKIESDDSTLSLSTTAGTRKFMAPEIARTLKHKNMTMQTDIFSLGVTYYFVVTDGDELFPNTTDDYDFTDRDIITKLSNLSDTGAWNKSTKELAINLLKAMLRVNPSERPNSETVCNHPLLWDKEQQIEFLIIVSNILKNDIDNNKNHNTTQLYTTVLNESTEDMNVLDCKWIDEIELKFDQNWAQRLRQAKGDNKYKSEVRDLLRAIRNKYTHETLFYTRIVNEINILFPKLLLYVYIVMLPYKSQVALIKYYAVDSHRFTE